MFRFMNKNYCFVLKQPDRGIAQCCLCHCLPKAFLMSMVPFRVSPCARIFVNTCSSCPIRNQILATAGSRGLVSVCLYVFPLCTWKLAVTDKGPVRQDIMFVYKWRIMNIAVQIYIGELCVSDYVLCKFKRKTRLLPLSDTLKAVFCVTVKGSLCTCTICFSHINTERPRSVPCGKWSVPKNARVTR